MKNLKWMVALWLLNSAAVAAPPTPNSFSKDNLQANNIILRVAWEFCQPEEEMLDWTFVDAQIYAARSQGKKVVLHIDPLSGVPAWVNQKLKYQSINSVAEISHNRLLTEWTKFIQRMGEKYAGEQTIEKVFVSQLSFESGGSNHLQSGEYIDSWIRILDAFGKAFPSHELVVTHPSLTDPHIVSLIQDYAAAHIGERYQSVLSGMESISSPNQQVNASASDLALWEQMNVAPNRQVPQNIKTGRSNEWTVNEIKSAEKSLKPVQKKRGSIIEKMVTNISLLGTPLWQDFFQ
jgi:hypothetical protein